MTPVTERNGAGSQHADRRGTPRRRVLKGATLTFNSGYSAFECVLRNESEGGAKLSLAETFALPKRFHLAIAGDSDVRTAHVVWRGMDQMGVRFE